MLRGSEMKCLMDFGNVTRLRTEMFAGLRKCYAAPNRNVCWTSEMLRGSDFATARAGQAMLDKSYVALRSCPRHYFTHVKACSCLFLLAFLHNGLLWHGHIGHGVISVGIFKVFYASVLSLVVARRRLDLLFFFFLSVVTFRRCLWCGELAALRLRVFLVLVSAIWTGTCLSRLVYVRSVALRYLVKIIQESVWFAVLIFIGDDIFFALDNESNN